MGDEALTSETNRRFWARTNYKPGQRLDMNDPIDRAMAKIWLDVLSEVRVHRARALAIARRDAGLSQFVLVRERPDGFVQALTFPRRSGLEVQYDWEGGQPAGYTYLAAFDLSQDQRRPVAEQFSSQVVSYTA